MAGGVTIRMGPVGEPPIWVGEQPARAGRARRANGRRIPTPMGPLAALLGDSPGMAALRERATRLLEHPSDRGRLPPLLIQGETGVGKGLLARALHDGGPRAEHRFVDVNCAAIPDTLLESELFGFERGAFTDARQPKAGLFQAADRGTLFLDEVALLPEGLQAKLLKVLEDREVRRLGATRSEPVDAWIVTASNADLAGAVRARRFREDLYHRLAVVTLVLPPLRERGPDVLRLAEHFLARACVEYGLPPKRLAPDAVAALLQHSWPGNVRELINTMERVALLVEAPVVAAEMLELSAAPEAAPSARETVVPDHPLDARWGPWSGPASSRPSTRRTGTSPGRHAAWESPATPCATGSPSMGSDPAGPGPRPRPSPPRRAESPVAPSRASSRPGRAGLGGPLGAASRDSPARGDRRAAARRRPTVPEPHDRDAHREGPELRRPGGGPRPHRYRGGVRPRARRGRRAPRRPRGGRDPEGGGARAARRGAAHHGPAGHPRGATPGRVRGPGHPARAGRQAPRLADAGGSRRPGRSGRDHRLGHGRALPRPSVRARAPARGAAGGRRPRTGSRESSVAGSDRPAA